MEQEPGTRPPASPDDGDAAAHRPAWIDSVPVAVLVAVTAVLALLVGVVVSVSQPSAAAGAADAPMARPPSAATLPAPSTGAPAPSAAAQQAAEETELRAEAARLTHPVPLRAPSRWAGRGAAPAGRPDAVAGCPHLAARLTAALGTTIGYWRGTLPAGPYGCGWAPVPLTDTGTYTYGGQAGYAYQLNVGWLADGSTPEQLRTGFYERGDAGRCPGVDVPAAGTGAVLVRCDRTSAVEYTLLLPDAGAAGVWLLHAQARDDAAHTPAEALTALVAAVTRAYP